MTPSNALPPAWIDRGEWPFVPKFLSLSAGRVHYVDEGAGDPILFVHGTPTWSFEYRHLIRALSKTHRCIAVDHLGFGLSERPAAFGYRPEDHAGTLAEFVQKLGLRNYTLVVHDFGGPIALPLALDPKYGVKRVVLMNTWMWSFADDARMLKGAKFAGSAFGRFLYRRLNLSLKVIAPSAWGDRRKLTPKIQSHYLAPFPDAASRGRVLWALARALTASGDYYDSLWQRREALRRLPVLIAWGLKDSAFKPLQLAKWEAALPEAKVVRIAEAGHWPHEEAPEEVIAALREFLGATPGAGLHQVRGAAPHAQL